MSQSILKQDDTCTNKKKNSSLIFPKKLIKKHFASSTFNDV